MPPRDAVRIEEMVNYFLTTISRRLQEPFSSRRARRMPWNADHRLARVGLKGRPIAQDKRPPSNLVFLIDVSGSIISQKIR